MIPTVNGTSVRVFKLLPILSSILEKKKLDKLKVVIKMIPIILSYLVHVNIVGYFYSQS